MSELQNARLPHVLQRQAAPTVVADHSFSHPDEVAKLIKAAAEAAGSGSAHDDLARAGQA